MDPTPGIVTFGDLLTPTGVLIAAATVTALVEILKAGIPGLDRRVSGASLALLLSLALYVATAFALPQSSPDSYLAVAVAWIACATSAMGIRAGAAHVGEVRAGTAGLAASVRVEDSSLSEGPPAGDPTARPPL